ncbi:MAG: hypothetical protein JHC95_00595 [Solirubrobacteraceae bacterium]|nr:hypothetical protein [Solirubrobacteraceae bacterium]
MPSAARLCAVAIITLICPGGVAIAGEGNPDPGFGTRGVSVLATGNANQSSGEAVVVQGDKAVIAGEAAENPGGGQRLRAAITRTNADGTRDAGFGTAGQTLVAAGTGDSQFFGVALAPDGKIVAVGTVDDGGTDKVLVVRFSANGVPDGTFGTGGVVMLARGNGGVAAGNAVFVEPDGTVVVAGQALDNAVTKMLRVKLTAGGSLAPVWSQLTEIGADGLARANAIGKLGDGTFVVAGEAADGDTVPFLARFSAADGVLTGGWGNQAGNGTSLLPVDTVGGAYGMVVKGGQIVIAGAAADGATEVLAAAFSASNGALDGSFATGGVLRVSMGDGGTSVARAIATDSAGRFMLAGRASQDVDGSSVFHFMTARVTAAGVLDTTYNPGGSGSQPGTALAIAPGAAAAHGNGLAIRADGKAVLAGRVGDGPGESLAAVRFCTAVAQPCFSLTGDVSLPAQSDLAMSEQCGSTSVAGTAALDVAGSYEGRVTVTVTSSNPTVFAPSAAQTVEAKRDGPLPVNYTVTHSGNAADSALLTITVAPEGRAAFTRTLTVRNTVLSVASVAPQTATTPRDMKPGSTLTLQVPGLDICGTSGYTGAPSPLVRIGNDRALVRASRNGNQLTLTTPRLATTGTVELATQDAANAIVARAAAPQPVTVDTYRNTQGFAFRNFAADPSFSDMVDAFGADDMFVCIHVPFVGCVPSGVPDPWALTVWTVLQFNNGSCFGFSWVSEAMRKGTLSPAKFNAAATNAFTIGGMPQKGDAPAVRPQDITDEIESAWARQFSEEYMDFYRAETLSNLVAQTPTSLRRKIEGMMAGGNHPLLSIRDGGSIAGLHVVTAYDVEDDPAEPGAYFIHVYDSNEPYDPSHIAADGNRNSDQLVGTLFNLSALNDSRIHVHANGRWEMPSSSFGGKQIANIIAGPWDLPPRDAEILGPASSLSTVATLLIAWTGEGLANWRQAGGDGASTDAPASITQITAGKKKLYSAPGVVNTNAATKLDVVPWTLATGGPAPVDGQFIPAGTPYEVQRRGDRSAPMTQVLFGRNTVTKVTTPVTRGVTDTIGVAPKENTVSVDPGAASAKIELEMSAKAAQGAWRTAALSTTTRGEDGLRFDRARDAYVIEHEGPATTVNLTFSSLQKTALPQEATARIRVGKNQTVSLKPQSWRKLGGGKLVVRSGGKTRRVALRGTPASRLSMGTPTARVKGKTKTAKVRITVPKGTAPDSAKLTYVVRRGKRRIATRTVSAGRPGRKTVTIKLPAATKRRDTLTVIGTALRPRGDRLTVATSTKTTRVR